MIEKYEVVIGCEIHTQLLTKTKAFCACENKYGGMPDTRVCPVCLGLPGAMPRISQGYVELGAVAGQALNCNIARFTKFDRKHYFYPDLAKGYQITQYDLPLCTDGYVDLPFIHYPKDEQPGGENCRTKNFKGEDCVKPQFKITDTTSFRYSSVMPNGQQIPSKGGFTANGVEYSFPKLTRALFTASKGCVFGKIDYGQIEYRLICNIACGEAGEEVRREYAENPHLDFHQYVVDLTGLSRKYAKNMSFGVSFGMGLPSMAESFGWTMEQAEEISEKYHEHMPFVKPTLALVGDVAKSRGYIKTIYGSHARLPDPKKSYTMLNRYTQGSGAECLKLAIVTAYKEGVWETLKVANTVHDELNMPYLEPTEEKMLALYRMAEIMRTAMPNLRIPLEASPELGDNWASTKEVSEWIELRDKNEEAWQKTSPELKQAVNICDKLLKEGRVSV